MIKSHREFRLAGSAIIAALSLVGVLAVSGCEERPYPEAAKSNAPPPSAPPAELAGGPSDPAYSPPPAAVSSAPPAPSYGAPVYSAPTQPYAGEGIVAMAPIPNPDERESGYARSRHRVHVQYYAGSAPVAPIHAAKPSLPTAAKVPTPPVYKATVKPTPAPYKVAAPAPTVAKVENHAAALAAGVAAGGAVAVKQTVAAAKTVAAPNQATDAAGKPSATPSATSASSSDRSTRVATLQSALADAISKGAKLTAPARFTANQPADVTLTVPATFAAAVRDEAGKDGLSDAAASVNLTAVLAGEGFAVTPGETQSQPLTPGEITEFHWTVTAQPNAKGSLHADMGADLLGSGSDSLALGSVQKAAGTGVKLTPKVVGAALLVLIAALIVAWLARGRGEPTRSASARRASVAARNRPLDMGMSLSEPARSEPEPTAH